MIKGASLILAGEFCPNGADAARDDGIQRHLVMGVKGMAIKSIESMKTNAYAPMSINDGKLPY